MSFKKGLSDRDPTAGVSSYGCFLRPAQKGMRWMRLGVVESSDQLQLGTPLGEEMAKTCAPVDRNNWVVCTKNLWSDPGLGYEHQIFDGLVFARCDDGRFSADRCMESGEDGSVLMHGVLLNRVDLASEFGQEKIFDLVRDMRAARGTKGMLSRLRGPFEGCFYDTASGTLTAFGNQTGDTAAYVYKSGGQLMVSNSFDLMQRLLLQAGIRTTFDERAARMMLSHGYMTDDSTFAREIKRVLPGHFVEVEQAPEGEVRTTPYWQLEYRPKENMTVEEAAALMQETFIRATETCFAKDREDGVHDHLVDISGGLDSRVINMTAKNLGYSQITNITYSETGTEEEKYSLATAVQLGNDCLYYPLNGGISLLDPELNLRLNNGAALYSGVTGGRPVLERLNLDRFGLEHTGQLGGAIFGTYASSPDALPANPDAQRYSQLHPYKGLVEVREGDTEETLVMRVRGFLGTASSHLLRRHYVYAVAPFLDVDLIDAAFTIPLHLRHGHEAYEQWLETYHPEALEAPTTRRLGWQIEALKSRSTFERYARSGVVRLRKEFYKLVRAPKEERPARYMSRTKHAYENNPKLKALIDGKEAAVATLDVSSELRDDLAKSFAEPGVGNRLTDKILATTVVTMYQLYFDEPLQESPASGR